MSDTELFLLLLISGGLLVSAYIAGANSARTEMVHRLLGMKRKNNRWEVRDGTELMGMKWVMSYQVYDDGKQQRRITYNNATGYWEFQDGTRPEKVTPGLKEIKGYWECNGKVFDLTQMKPLEFADALHEWASDVGKFLPLGIESFKIGLQVVERDSIIKKYGTVLEKAASMFRQESELPFPKAVIRRRLAEALLSDDLDDDMRIHLSSGFTTLEYFLPKDEFDIVNPLFDLTTDDTMIELLDRVKQVEVRGGDITADAMKIIEILSALPDSRAVWDRVSNRERERCYQERVLKSIALGGDRPRYGATSSTGKQGVTGDRQPASRKLGWAIYRQNWGRPQTWH